MTAAAGPDQRWRLGYQPALDGLRALAVAAVVLHHGQLLPKGAGGTVGVTAFFVLSGYLITSLLLEERNRTGAVALSRFYLRRGIRLLPALAIVVLATVGALIVVGRTDLVLAASFAPISYVGNWLIIAGVELGPMSHAWSLAIEEQFYVLWPFLFVVVAPRVSRTRLALALVIGAVAVTVARTAAISGGWSPERYGFGTDLQADGLLVGCAVALLADRLPVHRLLLPGGAIGLVALAATPVSQASWSLTIAAAVAVILGSRASPDRVFAPLLSSRPLTGLGRISYGVYLWHYPIMWHSGVMVMHGHPPQPLYAFVLALVTVVVAAASYRWVERPMSMRRTTGMTLRRHRKPLKPGGVEG